MGAGCTCFKLYTLPFYYSKNKRLPFYYNKKLSLTLKQNKPFFDKLSLVLLWQTFFVCFDKHFLLSHMRVHDLEKLAQFLGGWKNCSKAPILHTTYINYYSLHSAYNNNLHIHSYCFYKYLDCWFNAIETEICMHIISVQSLITRYIKL